MTLTNTPAKLPKYPVVLNTKKTNNTSSSLINHAMSLLPI